MTGSCECGCGTPTRPAGRTSAALGWIKGQPIRFIDGHQRRVPRAAGYRGKYVPSHPHAATNGQVKVHVLVASQALGRPLPEGVEVHHFDENTLNNEPSNLVICQDRAYHCLLHKRRRLQLAGGNPNTQRICATCQSLCLISEMASGRTRESSECKRCAAERAFRRRRAVGVQERDCQSKYRGLFSGLTPLARAERDGLVVHIAGWKGVR